MEEEWCREMRRGARGVHKGQWEGGEARCGYLQLKKEGEGVRFSA